MTGAAVAMDRILDTAQALKGAVTRTPLLERFEANGILGTRLLIKAEPLQRTGALKIRGACNRIRQLSGDERHLGVVTYSSGNHAPGVACAARLPGISALIVMPDDAAQAKRAAAEPTRATTAPFNRDTESSDEIVARLCAQTRHKPMIRGRIAEWLGTFSLLAAVVGSGIMAGRPVDAIYRDCPAGTHPPDRSHSGRSDRGLWPDFGRRFQPRGDIAFCLAGRNRADGPDARCRSPVCRRHQRPSGRPHPVRQRVVRPVDRATNGGGGQWAGEFIAVPLVAATLASFFFRWFLEETGTNP